MTAPALSLIAVALAIGVVLLLQHYTGLHRLPVQWRYALGLVTELLGLLAWAAAWGFLPWWLAVLALAACCVAGVPVALLMAHEQRVEAGNWAALTRTNREQAAQLALLRHTTNTQKQRQVRDLVESATFALGAAGREIADLQLFIDQAGPLLRPLIEAMKDGDE